MPSLRRVAIASTVLLLAPLAVAHALLVTSVVKRALVAAPPSPLPPAALPSPSAWHRTTSAALFGVPDTPSERPVLSPFDRPYEAAPCPGVRVAALAASGDVTASFATFEGAPGERATPLRQGDAYAGRVVWLVGHDRAWLVGADGLCQAPLRDAPLVAAAPPPSPSASSASGGLVDRIERRGPNEVAVDRATLDALLEQAPSLAKGVRAAFEQEGGRTVGLRVSGVRAGDPLAAMGLESGDRIERVADVELTGPDKGIEAYARARVREHVTIVVRRQGALRTIDVLVR